MVMGDVSFSFSLMYILKFSTRTLEHVFVFAM